MKKNQPQNQHSVSLQMLSDAAGPKAKKGPGFFAGFLVGFLLLLLPALGLGAALWFDYGDLKTQAASLLELQAVQVEQLEAKSLSLASQEAELLDLKQSIEDEQSQIDRFQQELSNLEASLLERQEELDERAARIASQEAELDELVVLYEGMDPEKAAAILAHGSDEILKARIMQRMNPSRLSLILTFLSPQEAADMIHLLADTP